MARRTINLSEKDMKKLEELVEHFDALSVNDAIRRSISQTSAVSKFADKDGTITIEATNGKKYGVRFN